MGTKIARKTAKVFASNAGGTGVAEFGSTAGGSTVYTTDPDVIQSVEFETGLAAGIIAGSKRLPVYEEINGVYYVTTRQVGYVLQEGIPEYDAGTEYFTNSIVKKAGTYEIYGSIVNNNLGNALTDATKWVLLQDLSAASGWGTGDVKITLKNTADTGWVMMNDGTIGDATSGGTTRANADTAALFALLWNNVSDTYAPVSTGRGANAAADFAAHKTIKLTRTLGRALGISGAGATLTSRALGEYLGAETHTLITAEMPAHTHEYGTTSTLAGGGANPAPDVTPNTGFQTGSTGGGGAHNNMQPTVFLNAMIKL